MSASNSDEGSQDESETQSEPEIESELGIGSAESESNFYTCLVCMNTAHEPLVAFCGHMFCSTCIRKWMKSQGINAKCPYCQSIIGDNTLITVNTTYISGNSGCQSIAEHRYFSNIVQTYVVPPVESMFIGGVVVRPPELMPRMKPLAPELLAEYYSAPSRVYFFDSPVLQRCLMLAIIFYLFIATLRMDGTI